MTTLVRKKFEMYSLRGWLRIRGFKTYVPSVMTGEEEERNSASRKIVHIRVTHSDMDILVTANSGGMPFVVIVKVPIG